MALPIHVTNSLRSQNVDTSRREEDVWLTVTDQFNIRQFLAFADTGRITYPCQLIQLLRRKLSVARCADNPAPGNLATIGRQVRYSLDGLRVCNGLLAVGLISSVGEVPIHSMAGATLIGMSVGQSATFLGSSGVTRTITLIEVSSCHLRSTSA